MVKGFNVGFRVVQYCFLPSKKFFMLIMRSQSFGKVGGRNTFWPIKDLPSISTGQYIIAKTLQSITETNELAVKKG
jgi:hypothetical protein